MPLIEFGNGRAVKEGQAVQVRQGSCDVVVKPIDLANPVHRATPSGAFSADVDRTEALSRF
jgi:hypothetical protein